MKTQLSLLSTSKAAANVTVRPKKTRSKTASERLQSKSLRSGKVATATCKSAAPKSLAVKDETRRVYDAAKIRWPEMVQYSFDSQHELRIFRWNLQQEEIAALKSETFSEKLKVRFEKAGAMHYLIIEIGGEGESFRAPISWWLLPTSERALPMNGAPLRVTLIDGKSGLIEVERELEMSSATEKALIACLQAQAGDTYGHLAMDAQLKQDLRA